MRSNARSRNERAGRRSRRQGFALEAKSNGWTNTGAFTGLRPVGGEIHFTVEQAINRTKSDAAKAMREWKRSLPKGVKI
jgi:hypothetical protein